MATENDIFVQPAIPRFDGHYDHWSVLMENFLRSEEYWSMVEHGIPAAADDGAEPDEAQRKMVEDAKLKDLKVKNYLFQAIDRTIMETILNRDTAKAIWDSMRQKYSTLYSFEVPSGFADVSTQQGHQSNLLGFVRIAVAAVVGQRLKGFQRQAGGDSCSYGSHGGGLELQIYNQGGGYVSRSLPSSRYGKDFAARRVKDLWKNKDLYFVTQKGEDYKRLRVVVLGRPCQNAAKEMYLLD